MEQSPVEITIKKEECLMSVSPTVAEAMEQPDTLAPAGQPPYSRILRSRNPSHDVAPVPPLPPPAIKIGDQLIEGDVADVVSVGKTGRAQRSSKQSKRKSSRPRKLKLVIKKGYVVENAVDLDDEDSDKEEDDEDSCDTGNGSREDDKVAGSSILAQLEKASIKKKKRKKKRSRKLKKASEDVLEAKKDLLADTDDSDDTSDEDYVADRSAKNEPWSKTTNNMGRRGRRPSLANGDQGLAPAKRRRHSDKESCEICGRMYHKRYIVTHMLKHRGDKPFACPLCQKKFVSKRSIALHIQKRHEGPEAVEREMYKQCALKKRFPCTICDKIFTRKTKLKDHINFHLGKSRHLCDHCGKMLLSRKTLRTHLLIHQDLKPYPCHMCSKSFRQQPVLKRHLTTHTGIKPFLCDACGKQFIHRVYLMRHKCPKAKQGAAALLGANARITHDGLLMVEGEDGMCEQVGEDHAQQHFMGLEEGVEPEIT